MANEFFKDKLDRLDPLTHIFERSAIEEYTIELVKEKKPFLFCFVDIDNFKNINDTYGHKFGDKVLVEISKAFLKVAGDEATVARYGGDEFIFVYQGDFDYDETWKKCYALLSSPSLIEDEEIKSLNITLTIGSSRYPLNSKNIDGIIELSDKALYRGKMKGRDCFIIYLPEKHANINLKSERDKVVSSTYLHNLAYKTITEAENLKKGITEVLDYFVEYFMIDHLCIQDSEKMYCESSHMLCRNTPFYPLPYSELKKHFTGNNAVFTKNQITEDDKSSPLLERLLKDEIYSILYVRIKYKDKLYGFLRADYNNNDRGRIWQSLHKDVLQVIANYIALELHSRNIELKDI